MGPRRGPRAGGQRCSSGVRPHLIFLRNTEHLPIQQLIATPAKAPLFLRKADPKKPGPIAPFGSVLSLSLPVRQAAFVARRGGAARHSHHPARHRGARKPIAALRPIAPASADGLTPGAVSPASFLTVRISVCAAPEIQWHNASGARTDCKDRRRYDRGPLGAAVDRVCEAHDPVGPNRPACRRERSNRGRWHHPQIAAGAPGPALSPCGGGFREVTPHAAVGIMLGIGAARRQRGKNTCSPGRISLSVCSRTKGAIA